jgi:biotin carboxylase
MAVVVIVGVREAALDAAQQLGHQVVLVGDRKVASKRRANLLATIEADFSTSNRLAFTKHCVRSMQAVDRNLPRRVEAVVGVTERAVLPAAWLRDQLGLPGTSAKSAYLCRNKLAMKRRLHANGVYCTDFASVTARTTAARLVQQLGLPLVVKPVDSSGSRGAVVARQQAEVEAALRPGMLAESFVHGIEMSVESFVLNGEVRFTNLTEYLVPLWSNVVPAAVPTDMQSALLELNRKVIDALSINRGMTHMEVFLTATAPLFSEVAIRPPGGCLMELIRHAYGFNTWHAFLNVELGQNVDFPHSAQHTAGVVFLHPGEGRVKRIAGLTRAMQPSEVVEATCSVSIGETLTRRQGSGDSVGHVLSKGRTRAEVVRALTLARRALVVELETTATKTRRAPRPNEGKQSE